MEKIGPYELNSIHCGECSELMAQLPDECIDLTVTSPPYDEMDEDLNLIPGGLRQYNGYHLNFGRLAQQLYRVTKPGGVVVWVVGDATIDGSETLTSFRQALYFRGLGFNVETMIYQKDGVGACGSNRYYWQAFEFMFVLSKGQPKTANRIADRKNSTAGLVKWGSHKTEVLGARTNRTVTTKQYGVRDNIWPYLTGWFSGDDKTDHDAPFPEALAHDHIISWSNPGDLILDPMIGSGTVAKMAVVTGRQYLGFDISQEYCDLARRRVGEVEREQRKEWRQIKDTGRVDDLPMFAGIGG